MLTAKFQLFFPMQRHFEALHHVINNKPFARPWGEDPIKYNHISLNEKNEITTIVKTKMVTNKDELKDLSDIPMSSNAKFAFLDINKNNDFDKHGFGARNRKDLKFLKNGSFEFRNFKNYNLYKSKQSYVRNASESLLYQGHGVDYNMHARPEKYVLNGLMHPTAEAHAIIGDMLYEEINENE